MAPIKTVRNILAELRKICQHPYISEPELETFDIPEIEQHKQLIEASGKLIFLKLLLPKLKERGHRVLLFSQFKIALDRIEDFLYGEKVKFLRLDGDVQQAQRQKSMDLFNAPNSEYDVFLLTTRAGGVGINLATADTVIIYDPDFNPHQDLQAIARSHRYGQKKKVLVFKLMVKGSVEENIINKGKKKMVLDHLVVQQMGKESEEGDIDDLLLRGAEAVYNNKGGINVPDIVYNSKNVDELIDKVEADAEQEAKEMAEREKAIAEGKVDPSKNKSNQQFGFAKIWEADQNQLLDIAAENEEEGEEGREANWEFLIAAMEKEKQDKLQELMISSSSTKKKRKAAEGIHFTDGIEILDEKTPEKKKHKNRKGKNKAILNGTSVSGSDSDYNDVFQNDGVNGKINGGHTSESEDISDVDVPDDIRGLGLDALTPAEREKYNHAQQQQRAQRRAEKRAQKIIQSLQSDDLPTVPGPSINPLPPPTVLQHGYTQIGAASSSANSHQAAQEGRPRKRGRPPLDEPQNWIVPQSHHHINGSSHSGSHYPPGTNHIPPQHPYGAHAPQLAEARNILNLLYAVLKEFGHLKNIRRWALIALPELLPAERIDRYKVLAEETDQHLASMRQVRYFSLDAQVRTVSHLFLAGAPAVIEGDLNVPHIPSNVGLTTSPQPRIAAPATAAPAPLVRKRIDISASDNRVNPAAGPSNHQMVQPSKASESLFNSLMDSAPPSCRFCSGAHELRDCGNVSSMEDLDAITKAINDSDDNPLEKTLALKNVERMKKLLAKAGRYGDSHIPASSVAGPSSTVSTNSTLPSTNGNIKSPNKAPRPPNQAAIPSSASKNGNKVPVSNYEIIEIADSPPVTIPTPNPPTNISTNNNIRNVEQSTTTCAFCEKSCGLPIRRCIETNGTRKLLKTKIRKCEDQIQGGDGSEKIRNVQSILYEVYKAWPREKK